MNLQCEMALLLLFRSFKTKIMDPLQLQGVHN